MTRQEIQTKNQLETPLRKKSKELSGDGFESAGPNLVEYGVSSPYSVLRTGSCILPSGWCLMPDGFT